MLLLLLVREKKCSKCSRSALSHLGQINIDFLIVRRQFIVDVFDQHRSLCLIAPNYVTIWINFCPVNLCSRIRWLISSRYSYISQWESHGQTRICSMVSKPKWSIWFATESGWRWHDTAMIQEFPLEVFLKLCSCWILLFSCSLSWFQGPAALWIDGIGKWNSNWSTRSVLVPTTSVEYLYDFEREPICNCKANN